MAGANTVTTGNDPRDITETIKSSSNVHTKEKGKTRGNDIGK